MQRWTKVDLSLPQRIVFCKRFEGCIELSQPTKFLQPDQVKYLEYDVIWQSSKWAKITQRSDCWLALCCIFSHQEGTVNPTTGRLNGLTTNFYSLWNQLVFIASISQLERP